MVLGQGLGSNAHRASVAVVHLVLRTTNVVDLQATDLIVQLSSNFCNGSISAHSAVNGEQHGDSLIFPRLVGEITQHILHSAKSSIIADSFHIGNNIIQISSISILLLQVYSSTLNIIVVHVTIETHNGCSAQLLNSLVQVSGQVSVISHGDLAVNSSLILQGSAESRRISSGGGGVGVVVTIGVVVGGAAIAGGQHGDSHDAGQHQRGNLLEFHSEFFLLM